RLALWNPCLFRTQLSSGLRRCRHASCDSGLWRPARRSRRAGQHDRHPVPSRKKPGGRTDTHRQLFAVAAMTRMRPPRPITSSDAPSLVVERMLAFKPGELEDLCDATDAAIEDGGGFGWVAPPPRNSLEAYWRGVMLVPERSLYVARFDGTICGSAQLLRPSRHNEAQAFAAQLQSAFLAPW